MIIEEKKALGLCFIRKKSAAPWMHFSFIQTYAFSAVSWRVEIFQANALQLTAKRTLDWMSSMTEKDTYTG